MFALIVLLQNLVLAVSGPPTSPEYLPIRVADAYGLFAREGLQVTVRSVRAESGAAEALAQAQADAVATSLEAVLRFGARAPAPPRLVFALTAAPPVVLVVARAHGAEVLSVKDLAGRRIAFTTPGSPEQTWLQALLGRHGITPAGVELVALGTRGAIGALDTGDIAAAFVGEPAASTLVEDGRARLLVDLRSPRAVIERLGQLTVNAAVFVRNDRRPSDADLAALARALLAAEVLIRTSAPTALAERLPRGVVGGDGEFTRRLETTRDVYLERGMVTPAVVAYTLDIIRAHLPLPRTLNVSRPADLLHLEPARRAVKARPPA